MSEREHFVGIKLRPKFMHAEIVKGYSDGSAALEGLPTIHWRGEHGSGRRGGGVRMIILIVTSREWEVFGQIQGFPMTFFWKLRCFLWARIRKSWRMFTRPGMVGF